MDSHGFPQRNKEFRDKLDTSVENCLGDRVDDMLVIAGLATAPAKQHHGYASALVRMVTARVCRYSIVSLIFSITALIRTSRPIVKAVQYGLPVAILLPIRCSIIRWASSLFSDSMWVTRTPNGKSRQSPSIWSVVLYSIEQAVDGTCHRWSESPRPPMSMTRIAVAALASPNTKSSKCRALFTDILNI